jgi:LysR family transcriptional regulator, flagellar master operon regulator
MDVNLAKTFLSVAETGSFFHAARKLNITQSTVSARVKTLEEMLGRSLFDRSKSGATLTGAGEQFLKHALALVRVWQHAQLEVGLSDQHSDHLAIGAPLSLWQEFLLKWVADMRQLDPEIAVTASAGDGPVLSQRLLEGTLDLALMYRPSHAPGLIVDHLFDEEFVLVVNAKTSPRRAARDYVFVDWGDDFQRDHAAAYPEKDVSGLHLDIGAAGLDYVLGNEASGYFPYRLVRTHVRRGRLNISKRARKFTYPVCMVYPETRDEEAYDSIIDSLRVKAATAVGRQRQRRR